MIDPDQRAADHAAGGRLGAQPRQRVLRAPARIRGAPRLDARLDALHLDYPFAGARMLRRLLRREGVDIGRRHVTTLMRRMGISAIAPQPGTSKRHRAHPVFPYLLRGRSITQPNQVWAMDISVPQQAA